MTPKQRLNYYLRFAKHAGLSPEDSDDFAQDAYIRFLKAGCEIALRFVMIDFLRARGGRRGYSRYSARFFELDRETNGEFGHDFVASVDEPPVTGLDAFKKVGQRLGVKEVVWLRRLAKHLLNN